MGIETEYAISANAEDTSVRDNPIELSFALVDAAAHQVPTAVRWDYRSEDPVNDARGYRLPRASARPEMLTDVAELRPTNIVSINGGRIYVDHAHPEYSSPEVMSPAEGLAYERAGDALMVDAARETSKGLGRHVRIYRNNTDGKGNSWGSHESYQVARSVAFETLSKLMMLHFVSRPIYTGAGRVGIGEKSEKAGYQLCVRADFFHAQIGLQTTFDRPIINTRDEPHSTRDYRRLHVIVGDANRMDVPTVLKLGTTSLLAWVAENAQAADFDLDAFVTQYELADPVEALHAVSHDLSLSQPLPLANGGSVTAWQLQVALRSAVYAVGAGVYGTDSRGEPLWPDPDTVQTVDLWGSTLAMLAQVRRENDDERLADVASARHLEWLLKWQLLEGMRRRKNSEWSAPLLSALDLSWADCDSERSVFSKMRARASALVTQEGVAAAHSAPDDTRAWLRAQLIRRFGKDVAAASWTSVVLRTEGGGLSTLDISDSARFSRSAAEKILDESATLAEVITNFGPQHTMKRE
jgi:proteasome accessory factor A